MCVAKTERGLCVYSELLPFGVEAFLPLEVVVEKKFKFKAYHGCWIRFNIDDGPRPRWVTRLTTLNIRPSQV